MLITKLEEEKNIECTIKLLDHTISIYKRGNARILVTLIVSLKKEGRKYERISGVEFYFPYKIFNVIDKSKQLSNPKYLKTRFEKSRVIDINTPILEVDDVGYMPIIPKGYKWINEDENFSHLVVLFDEFSLENANCDSFAFQFLFEVKAFAMRRNIISSLWALSTEYYIQKDNTINYADRAIKINSLNLYIVQPPKAFVSQVIPMPKESSIFIEREISMHPYSKVLSNRQFFKWQHKKIIEPWNGPRFLCQYSLFPTFEQIITLVVLPLIALIGSFILNLIL